MDVGGALGCRVSAVLSESEFWRRFLLTKMAVAQSLSRSPGSTRLDSSIEKAGQFALASLRDTLLDYYAATENHQEGTGVAVCIQSVSRKAEAGKSL